MQLARGQQQRAQQAEMDEEAAAEASALPDEAEGLKTTAMDVETSSSIAGNNASTTANGPMAQSVDGTGDYSTIAPTSQITSNTLSDALVDVMQALNVQHNSINGAEESSTRKN